MSELGERVRGAAGQPPYGPLHPKTNASIAPASLIIAFAVGEASPFLPAALRPSSAPFLKAATRGLNFSSTATTCARRGKCRA